MLLGSLALWALYTFRHPQEFIGGFQALPDISGRARTMISRDPPFRPIPFGAQEPRNISIGGKTPARQEVVARHLP